MCVQEGNVFILSVCLYVCVSMCMGVSVSVCLSVWAVTFECFWYDGTS